MPILLSASACTPIPGPGTEQTAAPQETLIRGERVPPFSFRQADGTAFTEADLTGHSTVLVFLVPGAPYVTEVLARVAEVRERLAGTAGVRYLVVHLSEATATAADGDDAEPPELPVPDALRADPAFREVIAGGEAASAVAALFGVVTWHDEAGAPWQTLNVAVVRPDRRVADLFPGVDHWTAGDLLAATAQARPR